MTSTGVLLSLVVPSPSWPAPLPPQHLTRPSLVTAQEWLAPAAIAMIDGPPDPGDDAGAALAGGVGDATSPDGEGVVPGVGLVADAQPATSTPTMARVATRDCDPRIRCPPDDVCQKRRSGGPDAASGALSACRHLRTVRPRASWAVSG
jgi:hypothetical protein